MLCRHKLKYHTTVNPIYEECHGFHLVEYDIVCSKCGKTIGHYAYGGGEPEYVIKYQLKGLKKLRAWLEYNFPRR